MRPSRQTAFAILAILAFLLTYLAPVAAAEPKELPRIGTDELANDSWIVTLAPNVEPGGARRIAREAGGRIGLRYEEALHGFQFQGSAQAAAALQQSPGVISVEPDSALYLQETLPFGIERIGAYEPENPNGAYQQGFRGAGARIAVLDTGIDLDHPDLVGSIDGALGKNCVNPALPPNDGYGHGTHVAGTAAAPLNDVGVVGVAPEARLVAVKMFDDAGNSSEALALCALDHIIALNVDADPSNDVTVANMSWGEERAWGDCQSDALHGAICAADAAGIILVAGSGNSAKNAGNFVPAAYPEVISVSALADFDGERGGLAGCGFIPELLWNECDDTHAVFSNFGPVDVIAPGVQVYSTWIGGGWKTSSGTSMAAPHVAGIAALIASAVPGTNSGEALSILEASGECPNGHQSDADGTVGCAGQGSWADDPDDTAEPMAHALRAVLAATGAPPPPPPSPTPTPSPTPPPGWEAGVGGDWVGTYGVDGYALLGWYGNADLVALPQATLSLDQGSRWVWTGTDEARALEDPEQSATRRAATWLHASSLRLSLGFSAAYSGTLHLYALDWSTSARRQTVVVDDGSGPRSTNINASFNNGAWIHVPIDVGAGGTVSIEVNRQAGGNAVLAGIFLGGAGTPPPTGAPPAWEEGVRGDWVGSYGADGYALLGWNGSSDQVALPQATLALERGTRFTWTANTTDLRAPENAGQTQRRSTIWTDPASVRLRLSFSTAYTGVLHVYAVDWSTTTRRQTVTVDDGSGPASVTTLGSSFNNGAWVHVPISVDAGGSVTVRADLISGANAILAGVFLGGAGTPP
jgi:subtilisin